MACTQPSTSFGTSCDSRSAAAGFRLAARADLPGPGRPAGTRPRRPPPDLPAPRLRRPAFSCSPPSSPPAPALLPLLILAPLRALIATETDLPASPDIGQLLLLLWLAAWALRHIVLRRSLPRLVWTPLYLPLLAFLLISGLSLFNAAATGAWLREWLKWLQILAIIALLSAETPRDAWRWPLRAVLLAGACQRPRRPLPVLRRQRRAPSAD